MQFMIVMISILSIIGAAKSLASVENEYGDFAYYSNGPPRKEHRRSLATDCSADLDDAYI